MSVSLDMKRKTESLTIYCDGSCYHKVRLGGVGIYIQWKDKEYAISKGYKDTTISRMEARAFLIAVRALKRGVRCFATFYIDSEITVQTLKTKFYEWEMGNLICENLDLWNEIFKELKSRRELRIKVKWVKGHRKDFNNPHVCGNFIADRLADYKSHKIYLEDK